MILYGTCLKGVGVHGFQNICSFAITFSSLDIMTNLSNTLSRLFVFLPFCSAYSEVGKY